MQEPHPAIPIDDTVAEDAYELSSEFVKEVIAALEEERPESIEGLISALHIADLAELFNLIPGELVPILTQVIGVRFNPEMLAYLDPEIRENVIAALGPERSAAAIASLETDDAIHIIEDLSEEEQQEILRSIPEYARGDLKEGLSYPENSAGRLMRKKLVTVPEFWNVGNTIDFLRTNEKLPNDFYMIFVVDPKYKPVGGLNLSRVVRSNRDITIRDIMDTNIRPIQTDTDQEEVGYIFRKYGLAEAPVISRANRLVGVITVDDVVDVIQEENEEDIMRMGGVSHQDIHTGFFETVKRRLPWLLINLLTATVASRVIGHFESEIQKLVTLAVLMPIVASIGGNAGTQAVTVTVRAIAERELKMINAFSVIRKEIIVGLINGVFLSLLAGAAVFVIFHDVRLSAVFAIAIIANLIVAGFAGAMIPLLFSRLKIDPAVASSVFLTMFTDACGFFAFLGFAALLLL